MGKGINNSLEQREIKHTNLTVVADPAGEEVHMHIKILSKSGDAKIFLQIVDIGRLHTFRGIDAGRVSTNIIKPVFDGIKDRLFRLGDVKVDIIQFAQIVVFQHLCAPVAVRVLPIPVNGAQIMIPIHIIKRRYRL